MKELTLRDIAERAGVSLSTVSLVINRKPNVSARMVEKIQDAMEELNYNPAEHFNAGYTKTGRGRKTNKIGLFLLGLPKMLLTASVYSEAIRGVEEALRDKGLALILSCVPNPKDFPRELSKLRRDGLLLLGDVENEIIYQNAWRYPCVRMMGELIEGPWFDQICVDNNSMGKLAADYLHRQGYNNCAFLGRNYGLFAVRKDVFCRRVVENCGVAHAFTSSDIVTVAEDYHYVKSQKIRSLVDELLTVKPRIEAIMLDSDTIAFAVYQSLITRNIRPGKDIKVISCDNAKDIISGLYPPPVSVDPQSKEIGRKAVEQLVWRIANPDSPKITMTVTPKIETNAMLLEPDVLQATGEGLV